MQMKALKDFRGRPGEGTSPMHGDRFVEAGCEFAPQGPGRAEWLETQGLAIPAGPPAVAPEPRASAVRNEAAETGPLAPAGGGTGAGKPASSSPAGPARKPRARARRRPAAGS